MNIHLHLISGLAFGLEYVPADVTDEGDHVVVLDIGVFRFLFCWMPSE